MVKVQRLFAKTNLKVRVIEVKRMSPTAVEMLDQLNAVCKRFGVDYYAASQNQRDLLDSIAVAIQDITFCLKLLLLLYVSLSFPPKNFDFLNSTNLNFQISLCKQPLNLHHQLQFPDGC